MDFLEDLFDNFERKKKQHKDHNHHQGDPNESDRCRHEHGQATGRSGQNIYCSSCGKPNQIQWQILY